MAKDKGRMDELICIKDSEINGLKREGKEWQDKYGSLEIRIDGIKMD